MLLAETIKEFDNFIPRGVDLIDQTSIFLLRTIPVLSISKQYRTPALYYSTHTTLWEFDNIHGAKSE